MGTFIVVTILVFMVIFLIITVLQRRQVEKTLKESNERLRLFLEDTTDGIWDWNPKTGQAYFSHRCYTVLGYKPDEFPPTQASWRQLIHPDDVAAAEKAMQQALDENTPFAIEIRLKAKNGDWRWVLVRGKVAALDAEGKAFRVAGFYTDITAYKLAEEELDRQTALFRNLFESSPEAIAVLDGQDRVLEVNRSFETLFGYPEAEALGQNINDLVAPGPYLDDAQDVSRLVIGNGQIVEKEAVRCTRDGRPLDVSLIGYPIIVDQCQIGAYAIYRDITARERAEQELRQANLVIENSPVVLFRWRAVEGWPVVMVSQNVIQFGYTPEELLSEAVSFVSLVHPEDIDRIARELEEYSTSGTDRFQQEYRIITKTGGVRWVDDRTVAERNVDGQIVFYQGTVIDITERKRIEESLKQEQEFVRELLENMVDGVVACDATGNLVLFNHTAREWHGLDPQPIPQEEWASYYDLYDEDGVTPLTAATIPLARAFRGERLRDAALVIRAKGQAPRYITSNCAPFYDSAGQLLGAVTVMRDLTAARQAQKELEDTRILLEATFEQTPVPMVLVSTPDNVIRIVNHAARYFLTDGNTSSSVGQRLLDYEPSWQDFDSDGCPIPFTEIPLSLALQGITTRSKELNVMRKDGTRRWNLASAAPIYNAAGEQIAAYVAFIDITDRKRAEDALRESEQRLSLMVEQVGAILWTTDRELRFTLIQGAGLASLGGRTGRMLGHTLFEYFQTDDDEFLPIMKHRRALRGESMTYEQTWNNRTFETRLEPLRDAFGNILGVIGVSIDITERKQAEAKIRKLNEELEQRVIERTAQLEAANKELEAFSYSVSHDLRAPLRAIDGYTRILVEDYEPVLDTEGKRVCAVIRDNTQRMGQLIEDLLAFSRLGRVQMQVSLIDMAVLSTAAFDQLTTLAERARIEFHLGPLPPAIGDPAMIRQVWVNLLANAIKFSARRERAVIEVNGRVESGENVYSVRDNGAGFDMRYADKLFGVFQRLHSEREFVGTGVGLAIIQRIIHRHNGRVWAEGEVGMGATFYFTLPRKED